ncbi:hypothetical protein CYY_000952 [Polysphondylium violaceum]|uniref:Required for respiratory growth protein 9, mitochondrial n=1 Tax=Polysphondylium violaceum TaxID=133409 RepID=A0A8J4Q1X5_9MYCE|nr:hypothetical protein CYY_000952 [Polysphondylium violaceum]
MLRHIKDLHISKRLISIVGDQKHQQLCINRCFATSSNSSGGGYSKRPSSNNSNNRNVKKSRQGKTGTDLVNQQIGTIISVPIGQSSNTDQIRQMMMGLKPRSQQTTTSKAKVVNDEKEQRIERIHTNDLKKPQQKQVVKQQQQQEQQSPKQDKQQSPKQLDKQPTKKETLQMKLKSIKNREANEFIFPDEDEIQPQEDDSELFSMDTQEEVDNNLMDFDDDAEEEYYEQYFEDEDFDNDIDELVSGEEVDQDGFDLNEFDKLEDIEHFEEDQDIDQQEYDNDIDNFNDKDDQEEQEQDEYEQDDDQEYEIEENQLFEEVENNDYEDPQQQIKNKKQKQDYDPEFLKQRLRDYELDENRMVGMEDYVFDDDVDIVESKIDKKKQTSTKSMNEIDYDHDDDVDQDEYDLDQELEQLEQEQEGEKKLTPEMREKVFNSILKQYGEKKAHVIMHKIDMKIKFGKQKWDPYRKLSREQMNELRALFKENPEINSINALSKHYGIHKEAVGRIIHSKWTPSQERMETLSKRKDLEKGTNNKRKKRQDNVAPKPYLAVVTKVGKKEIKMDDTLSQATKMNSNISADEWNKTVKRYNIHRIQSAKFENRQKSQKHTTAQKLDVSKSLASLEILERNLRNKK